MVNFHFLRPWWLLLLLVVILALMILLSRKNQRQTAWSDICDAHLLAVLMESRTSKNQQWLWICSLFAAFWMIIALAGPTWKRIPTKAFQPLAPRVLVLSLAESILEKDLSPDRLARAKFTLLDRLQVPGQWGMIAYTDEPFVVSPMTLDGQTIAALMPTISPDIMPVGGENLASSLQEAKKLLAQAGFTTGQILVLTAENPSQEAINYAHSLAGEGISTSVMYLRSGSVDPSFEDLALAGKGMVFTINSNAADWDKWSTAVKNANTKSKNALVVWVDEGRWFLFPSLLALLPLFRRNAWQEIS